MDERWLSSLPADLPEDMSTITDDPFLAQELTELFGRLKMLITQNRTRKQKLWENHKIMLDSADELKVRVNLLIDMFIGVLSPERLNYEIKWQEKIAGSLEEAYSKHLEAKRQQNLHLPGGGVHRVRPVPPQAKDN